MNKPSGCVSPPQTSPDYARVISDRHFLRLKDLLDSSGGKVEAGGQSDRETRYIAPTIVRNPAIDSKLMRVCFV